MRSYSSFVQMRANIKNVLINCTKKYSSKKRSPQPKCVPKRPPPTCSYQVKSSPLRHNQQVPPSIYPTQLRNSHFVPLRPLRPSLSFSVYLRPSLLLSVSLRPFPFFSVLLQPFPLRSITQRARPINYLRYDSG